jgi:hypothetical protein
MILRISAALLLSLTTVGISPGQSSSPAQRSLDIGQYVAELKSDSAAARRLKDHPEEAAALEERLQPEWVVAAGAETYAVHSDWLREQMKTLASDPSRADEISGRLVARLDAMEAGARAMMAPQSASVTTARGRLDEILKGREYRGVTGPSPLQGWWDRATDWIAEKLGALFSGVRRHQTLSTTLVWLLAAAVALLLIVWLVRTVLRSSKGTRLRLENPPVPETTEWARQALACADRGDYREAIRLVYCTAVARLEESGLWQMDSARTPREYLRLVPRDHLRPPLAALTMRFEGAWYAGRQVSADDFRGALAELGDLGCQLVWNPATASSF